MISWWYPKSTAQGVDPLSAPDLRDNVRGQRHAASAAQRQPAAACPSGPTGYAASWGQVQSHNLRTCEVITKSAALLSKNEDSVDNA